MRAIFVLATIMAMIVHAAAQAPRDHLHECAFCHGEEGIAKDKDVPHLAGQSAAYLLKQMRDFKAGRRAHREMRIMSREMTDTEMRAIAEYYESLPR